MRRPASEKAEIVRLVARSPLPVRRGLETLGIPRATFHRWCGLHQTGGAPRRSRTAPPGPAAWGRVPRSKVVVLALERPELSPREMAVRFTDEEECFVSEVGRTGKRSGGPFPRRTGAVP